MGLHKDFFNRLIATYDVFECGSNNNGYAEIARLIATYDVFECFS